MRIFLAGGTGVIGTRLIPALLNAGHHVTATTRKPASTGLLEQLGAVPVVMDVYDVAGTAAAVQEAAPDIILHELTDLGDYDTEANARLRREGTASLVAAAQAAGVQRIMVQSIAWAYQPGQQAAAEEEPVAPGSAVETMEALAGQLPQATVLRYGMLYGPGTWYAAGGRIAEAVAAGHVPATSAVTSFVHIDDAIAATVQALDWPAGAYNITDDEPAAASIWLPAYARQLGAPEPVLAPLPAGAPAGRGAANAKARALGWEPAYPSWRDGFARKLG